MSRIDNNVFVTKNGHICEKSKKGKRKGTAIGAIAGTTYIAAKSLIPRNNEFYKSIGAKNYLQAVTKFIKNENDIITKMFTPSLDTITLIKPQEVLARGRMAYIMNNMSKFGRFAFVAGSALAVIGLTTLIGRGIGKIADKVTNKRHAEQADAQ